MPKRAALNDLVKAEPASSQRPGPSQRGGGARRSTPPTDSDGGASGSSSQAAGPSTQGGRGKRARRSNLGQGQPQSSRAAEARAAAEAAQAAAAAAAAVPELPADDGSDADADLLQRKTEELEAEAEAASQSQSQGAGISAGEETRLVRSVVRFMLFRQAQKPGVPVKREELSKLVLADYANQRTSQRLTGHILRKAAAVFPKAFGLEMAEVSLKAPGRAGDAGGKAFLLRSLLPARLRGLVPAGRTELTQALAMVLLPLVALSGGRLSEEDLSVHLGKLGLSLGEAHPALGKPAEQLQELVARRYLVKSKVEGAEGAQWAYAMGPAAMEEIGEEQLKGFIEQVFAGSQASGQLQG